MSGTVIPVEPGNAPTQLSGASLAAGTTLYNMDSNNAVWLSSSRAVSPNNGIFLAPLATCQWSKDAQAWACVDTGVNASVNVNVSGDVSQIDNPVALATAVAVALLASGVSIAYPETLIGTFNLPAPGSGTPVLDVHNYASLRLSVPINVNGSVSWAFVDPTTGARYSPGSTNAESGTILATSVQDAIIKVQGSEIQFTNTSVPGAITIQVYGSARPQGPTPQILGTGDGVYEQSLGSTAMVAGTNYQAILTRENMPQGPCYIEAIVTGSTAKGLVQVIAAVPSGPTLTYDITDTTEMHAAPSGNQQIYKPWTMPMSPWIMQFNCTTSGTANVILRVIPASYN